jgi:hypothetical protein
MGAKDWDPDAALESLRLESTVSTEETYAKTAQRLLEECTPAAVLAITHLAQHSTSERIRLEAAKCVLDRVLGRVQDATPVGKEDPFKTISDWLTKEESESNAS